MGTVLPFARHGATRPSLPQLAGTGASIVIFPGVRYERTTDAPDRPNDETAAQRRASRGRRKSGRGQAGV